MNTMEISRSYTICTVKINIRETIKQPKVVGGKINHV